MGLSPEKEVTEAQLEDFVGNVAGLATKMCICITNGMSPNAIKTIIRDMPSECEVFTEHILNAVTAEVKRFQTFCERKGQRDGQG
jgi:hypothetical protein